MWPRQWGDRIPAAFGGTGRSQVAVLAPQEETATVVIGPEEMDCEHRVDCTGGSRLSPEGVTGNRREISRIRSKREPAGPSHPAFSSRDQVLR